MFRWETSAEVYRHYIVDYNIMSIEFVGNACYIVYILLVILKI
jgi:hypothetical protein